MMLESVFILIAYIAGTYMGFKFGRGTLLDSIETTIDQLIAQGYLRSRKDKNGEVEILKWNHQDNQN